ncbi:hypothetical protein ILFOPFJJ_00905 [Ensifer psoraleae]|nr:hypothetical protein [Sinorhizobium psoraleae]
MFGEDRFLPLVLINILGLAGILVWHIQGRSRPTGRLIVQILFFATMSLVLGLGRISPYRLDQTELQGAGLLIAKSARILWWTHLAWTIIGFVHIYIGLNHRPREAHLLQDLIIAVVYLGVALSIIGFVFGAPIGPFGCYLGRGRRHHRPGAAEYACGRLFGDRAHARAGLSHRRLDPAQRRHGRTRRRNQLALDESADRRAQFGDGTQQRPGEARGDQSQPS